MLSIFKEFMDKTIMGIEYFLTDCEMSFTNY